MVIVPHAAPLHPAPETLQFTAMLAVNCWVAPVSSVALVGLTTTGGTIVTDTEAELVATAWLVAVMVTVAGVGAVAGAVYRPVELIVPHAAPVQPAPETLQFTPMLAVNCWVAPVSSVALVGLTSTGGSIVTEAEPDLVGSDTLVAVTVTVAGAVAGAVYRPVELIVPHAAPVQPAPETLQDTAVFVVPATVAVNCCLAPVTSVTGVGLTPTATGTMVTVADAELVARAWLVAVMVTVAGVGTVAGAV